jgi:hypothetical protein
MTITPGRMLGTYEVRSPLGAGGMEIYKAKDIRLDRSLALGARAEGEGELEAQPRARQPRRSHRARLVLNFPEELKGLVSR